MLGYISYGILLLIVILFVVKTNVVFDGEEINVMVTFFNPNKAITAIIKPKNIEPLSPIKILAGLKLCALWKYIIKRY